LDKRKQGEIMGTCTCGYTRDYEEYCDGTHKVVREVRNKIVEELKNQEWHEAAEFVRNMK
jgi:CDGSH-type Zn-finger protein